MIAKLAAKQKAKSKDANDGPRPANAAEAESRLFALPMIKPNRSGAVFPFADVKRKEMMDMAESSALFDVTISSCILDGSWSGKGTSDAETGMSEYEVSYFYIMCRSLDLISAMEGITFKGKIFYDMSGSSGRNAMAALTLQDWGKVESIEAGEIQVRQAEALVGRLPTRFTQRTEFLVTRTNFLTYDFFDADVVFFDATIYHEFIDEGTIVSQFGIRADMMQAGTYAILLTHWEAPLFSQDFRMLHCDKGRRIDDDKSVVVWLYKKTTIPINRKRLANADSDVVAKRDQKEFEFLQRIRQNRGSRPNTRESSRPGSKASSRPGSKASSRPGTSGIQE